MILDTFYENVTFLLHPYPVTNKSGGQFTMERVKKNTPQYKYRNIYNVTR